MSDQPPLGAFNDLSNPANRPAAAPDAEMTKTWCFDPGHEHGVDGARLDHCRAARRVVPIAPDPARDARVAARRAADAVKAGRALDNLLQSQGAMYRNRVAAGERFIEELGDYLVSRLQHNRNYGVPDRDDAGHRMPCGRIECQVGDGGPHGLG